jgi:uncharacterized membrane-anchored protein YhcB (DUF1043 family)
LVESASANIYLVKEFLHFLTSDTSPWWTTLAGVALGYFFSRANENTKAKREARQKWVQEIQTISSDFVSASTEVMRIKSQMRGDYLALPHHHTGEELKEKQLETRKARYEKLAPVLLRAHDCVNRLKILNAGVISDAANEQWDHILTSKIDDNNAKYNSWYKEYRRLHKHFIATAQRLVPSDNHKKLLTKADTPPEAGD